MSQYPFLNYKFHYSYRTLKLSVYYLLIALFHGSNN